MNTELHPSLTTAQKTAAALAVSCFEHDKDPGEACPAALDGACMRRRERALDGDGRCAEHE